MKTLKKLAPHAAILIGNMYYVFWGIDRVNQAMNFIDNGYTKLLLLALIAFCTVNALTLLPMIANRLARTNNPAPQFVRLGILALNALLAAIILILLTIDLFNEDLMIFLSGFVKFLILLLCVTGLLCALQITARDRAYIRAMNRRAAQRRGAQPNRPAPQPRPTGAYPGRQSSYRTNDYSERRSYSRQNSGYSERAGYSRQSSHSAHPDYSRPAERRSYSHSNYQTRR